MKYFIGFLVIIVLGVTGFFVSSRDDSEPANSGAELIATTTGVEHSIVLTKDGYEPSEITISAGDKIVFSANSEYGKLHWPASNLHPTHSIYSEFDPLKPIEPEATWGFVFERVGEWRFHDHLAPYHTGTITVE